jgi:polar amino acid transport system substrate-binding protein
LSSTLLLDENVKKLITDRIDIIAYEENVLKYTLSELDQEIDQYETVMTLKDNDLYFCFHKYTPDSLVNEFNTALIKVKESNQYKDILLKYL